MLPIRTILHPTDFSESSQGAFELACALARDYKAKLVLIHVVPQPRVYAPDGIAVGFPNEPEPYYDVRVQLARMKPTDPSIEVEPHVLEGDAAPEILKAAKTAGADMIVMGTHGTSGITRLLVGSIAESVMRDAPCPVLTVRGQFRLSPVAEGQPVA